MKDDSETLATRIRSIVWNNAVQRPGFLQPKLIMAQGEAGSVQLTPSITLAYKQVIWVKFSNMWDQESLDSLPKRFDQASMEDSEWPLKVVDRFDSYIPIVQALVSRMNRDWSTVAVEEKISQLTQYADLLREISRHYVIAVPMTNYFESKLQKSNPALLQHVRSYKKVDMTNHYDSLVAIKYTEKQGNKNIKKLIQDHVKRFAWIQTAYNLIEPYTEAQVREELEGLEITPDSNRVSSEKSIDLEGLQIGVFVRNRTKELCQQLWYAVEPLSTSIAHDLGLSRDQYYQLTEVEVIESLRNGKSTVSLKRIAERSHGFATGVLDEHLCLLTGPVIDELYHFYNPSNFGEITKIVGTIGCKGIVQGKVRIVLSHDQFSTLQPGEILVASMTTPDYVVLMKKAAGIITDEGGLASHAALLSRELKIPCIIGTKIATKILKDGNMVEVDADSGIVRILDEA